MVDLVVLALQMDQTRIATLVFEPDLTYRSFNFLDGVSNRGMHGISHHREEASTLEEYQKINQFHVELLVRAMQKMSQIDEGDGTTLLDNTMILFGSSMRDGDEHDANDLPLILASGSNCDLKTGGRHIRYEKLEDRRLCNLHLALAQQMGAPDEDGSEVIHQFGNSHYPLPGLRG